MSDGSVSTGGENFNPGTFPVFVKAALGLKRGLQEAEKRRELRSFNTSDVLSCAALYVAYFTVIFSRSFLSPLASAIKEEESWYTTQRHASILIFVGVFYGIGKIIGGIAVSTMDGRMFFIFTACISSVMVLLISFIKDFASDDDTRFALLAVFCCVNAVAQACAWPAAVAYVYDRFRREQWGRVFAGLGLASRGGAVSTGLSLGLALEGMSWNSVVLMASMITMAGSLVFLSGKLFLPTAKKMESSEEKEKKEEEKRPFLESLTLYASWFTDIRFTSIAFAVGFLGVMSGLDGLLTFWATEALGASNSTAGAMTAIIPAGIACSLIGGGVFLEKMRKGSQGSVVLLLVFITLLCASILAFLTLIVQGDQAYVGEENATAIGVSCCILFIYGIGLGYPYYIPPSVFALEFAGAEAGMASSLMDVITAVMGAGFAAAGGELSKDGQWSSVMFILMAAGVLTFGCYCVFHWNNLKSARAKGSGKEVELQEQVVQAGGESNTVTVTATAAASAGADHDANANANATNGDGAADRSIIILEDEFVEYDPESEYEAESSASVDSDSDLTSE